MSEHAQHETRFHAPAPGRAGEHELSRRTGTIGRLVRRLLHGMVDRFDARVRGRSPYMHFIVDTSVRAFVDFMFVMRMVGHRQALPAEAWHLARILSAQSFDCGTCVQTSVNMALLEGVSPAWITAGLERRPEDLPAELREIYAFTNHILQHSYLEDELRESIRRRYGDRALIDLAYGIATAPIFPLTKQVLGFAKSCSQVRVQVGSDT